MTEQTPTYETLLENTISTYANEMGWEHGDDLQNAVENVTLAFEAADIRGIVDRLRLYESQSAANDEEVG